MTDIKFTYVVKWNNGYWKIFDTVAFTDVDFFWLQKDADEAAYYANGGK